MSELSQRSYHAFYQVYHDIKHKGKLVSPRGQKVLEIENYNYVLPPYVRFASFEARKLKIDYIKKELLWYLKGDRYDLSITEQASMWKTLVNADGGINSNYGQYIFFPVDGLNQFNKVVKFLSDDKDSRRASIVILSRDHVLSETNDLPCTYAMNFRIRDNKLNMTVRMRSQDMVFGMGNDAPTFSFTQEMVFTMLREVYPELELGEYYHSVDSAHIYERHFDMLDQILVSDVVQFPGVECPQMTYADVVQLRVLHRGNKERTIALQSLFTESGGRGWSPFTNWVTDGQFADVYPKETV